MKMRPKRRWAKLALRRVVRRALVRPAAPAAQRGGGGEQRDHAAA